MKTWRKGSALLLVGMMMMTGLVAISAPAIADTTLSQNRFSVVFNDANMFGELIYDVDPDGSYYLLGEGDGVRDYTADANTLTITLELENIWPPVTAALVNITSYDANVFDFNDPDHETHPQVQGGAWAPIPADNATNQDTFSFDFDVLRTTGLGYNAGTQLGVRIWYTGAGAGASGANVDFNVHIYLSSIFDDPATNDHEGLVDLWKTDETLGFVEDVFFEAGDRFAEANLGFTNHDSVAIDDLAGTLTVPIGGKITTFGGMNVANIDTIAAGATVNNAFKWRINVADDTIPDIYQGSVAITYVRDGQNINEGSFDLGFPVNFNFRNKDAGDGNAYSPNQCVAGSVVIVEDGTRQVDYVAPQPRATIEQSTYTDRLIKVNVTIVNNGNHPLYNVEFELDTDYGGAWTYFRNPRFFYESAGTTDTDTISRTIDELAVGANVTFTIEMIVESDIPIGEHRLPILYRGYWYNTGNLGGATGFEQINGGTDLEVIFSIFVDDSVIQCYVSGVTADFGDKSQIVTEVIYVELTNLEDYNFIDVTVRANFTGTPYYNPIIGMSAERMIWADDANPFNMQDWGALGTLDVMFTVDTDPNLRPDRYPFRLEITAVIEDTLAVVMVTLDYTQGAVIDFSGYGPDIYIYGFTNDDIVPGKSFDLNLTLENVGDDTLRDVTVMIVTDGTDEYPWDLESSFKEQFDWSGVFADWGSTAGGQVTWNGDFPEDMFYTLEDLDVDNVREIVEINLYMDGVYARPAARIAIIHIIELAPGDRIPVGFSMIADKDMVNGKPYDFPVMISGIDSFGDDYSEDRWITVMTSLPGKSYNPVELNWFDAGLKALALFLFVIIVLAILMFVYNMFKGEPYDEDEDDFDFEDDDEPFEPIDEPAEEAPEAPEQELVEP